MPKDILSFIGSAIRHPLQTGALIPSSPHLAQEMISRVPLRSDSTVIEIGPGTGAITALLLDQIEPDRYVGVELNPKFHYQLTHKYPGATFVLESAENLEPVINRHGKPDTIVCSLPWAFFSEFRQQRILTELFDSLAEGGHISTFAYVHGRYAPGGLRFSQLLRERFGEIEKSSVIWRNFLPAVVYHCLKRPVRQS